MLPYNVKNFLFYFCGGKNPWDFDGNCFESVDCFTKHGHFNNDNSSNHEHMIYFHFCMTSFFFFKQCCISFNIQVFHILG